MKKTLTVLMAAVLTACSSTKTNTVESPQITPIQSQQLTSSFKRKEIKLEWECTWGTGWSEKTCVKGDIKGITVTGYATSNGNSENNRELAFRLAEVKAKARLRHFLYEDIQSSIVKTTLTKNIEKANDKFKNRFSNNEPVEMSEEDAKTDTNWAVRENTNDIVRTVTETVRANAAGILKGVYVVDQEIIDRQTVAVTVRWSKQSQAATERIRSLMGK